MPFRSCLAHGELSLSEIVSMRSCERDLPCSLTFESPIAILSNVKPTHLKIIVADQAITHNSKRIVVRTGRYTHFYLAGLKRDGCLCNSARLDHINGKKFR